MQNYTRSLVTEELNLGNMLEAAVRDIEADRAKEANIQTDDDVIDEEEKLAEKLFSEDNRETTDEDYEEFEKFKESLRREDEENGFE